MSLTRIHNLSISLDGFATGEPQSAEAPFGHAGERLHEWMFGTRFWDAGGTAGVDDAFPERHSHGIGAEIMGANNFGPPAVSSPSGVTHLTITRKGRLVNVNTERQARWANVRLCRVEDGYARPTMPR